MKTNMGYVMLDTDQCIEILDNWPKYRCDFPEDYENADAMEALLEYEVSDQGRKREHVVVHLHRRYMKYFSQEDREYWINLCGKK